MRPAAYLADSLLVRGDDPETRGDLETVAGEAGFALEWDAVNWPYASVAHLGEGRTTLALWLTGGRAELPVGALPCGGKLEVTLSDGVNSVTSIVER